ncbi:MAG: CPBP family intramembrane glutamic endopeptidase [Planctomycetota bacterium]
MEQWPSSSVGSPPVRLGAGRNAVADYLHHSKRPWHVLLQLLPAIVLYELGTLIYFSSGEAIFAQRLLADVFHALGVPGLHLPAVLLVGVLLIWQFLSGESWRPRWPIVVGMFFESWLLALPVVVIALIVSGGLTAAVQTDVSVATTSSLPQSWPALLTVAIGAGIYEEMLFRFILILAIHAIVVDALRLRSFTGYAIAIAISSLMFAFYHNPFAAGEGGWGRMIFYTLAGVYFGLLFVARGLGIAAGAHACYDVIALVLVPSAAG